MALNNITLTGRLTGDPESIADGKGAKFSLAVDRTFKKEGQPTADFFTVVVWVPSAVNFILTYLTKGSLVGVTGSMESNKYTTKEGANATSWQVNGREITGLGAASQAKAEANAAIAEAGEEEFDPFADE